ncbi:MAG: hypothetical protein OJF49_000559 [Ktedonobacterales bacterium]|nr:MAG: hypothetical protein OJF49_000559 [Ktedonobacterales bacterium]
MSVRTPDKSSSDLPSGEEPKPGDGIEIPPRAPTLARLSRLRRRTPLAVVGGALLLALALVLPLADSGRTTTTRQARAESTPTATLAPTPTATVVPTPTPMPGFQVYIDRSEEFVIQYPETWTSSPASPGIEFDDNPNTLGYIVQVLLPGDATTAGQTSDPDDATVWVRYELNTLASKWQGNYQELTGPSPAAYFGGATWQTGVALLSVNGTSVRVQIYATVYQGKPYIINLLATQEKFATGVAIYFTPMLQSFQFLPSNA